MSYLCHACAGSGLTAGRVPALHILRGPSLTAPVEVVDSPGHCPACKGTGQAHVLWDAANDGQAVVWLSRLTLDRARAVN